MTSRTSPSAPTRRRSGPRTATTVLVLACLLVGPAPAARAAWWDPGPSGSGAAPARDGVWPLLPRPRVVEGFDPPAVRWGAGHRGVDLAGSPGAVVRGARGGLALDGGREVGVRHRASRDAGTHEGGGVAAGRQRGGQRAGGEDGHRHSVVRQALPVPSPAAPLCAESQPPTAFRSPRS